MNKFNTLVESVILNEKLTSDGKATALADLWKFDGPDNITVFDTFWSRIFGDATLYNKGPLYSKVSRILSRYKPGDKIKSADKIIIIEDLALSTYMKNNFKDHNSKLASNILKNKQAVEIINKNRMEAIKNQINNYSGHERRAMTMFFNKYGDKMSTYAIYHTYPDLSKLEDSSDEYISAMSRASVSSAKYVGEVIGGPYEMQFTENNPIIVTDVRGL